MKALKILLLLAVILSTAAGSVSAQKCCCIGKAHEKSMHESHAATMVKNHAISPACCCPNHGKCELAPIAQINSSDPILQLRSNIDYSTNEYSSLKSYTPGHTFANRVIKNRLLLKSKEPPHYILHRSLLF